MVKPLAFKGDKKSHKKRKRAQDDTENEDSLTKQSLTADRLPANNDDDDENWVSADTIADIAGPVMLILPTSPVACVAADQFGKVFASTVENMVEGEAGSAEPHDVRQVWVAQRIVGSEDSFTFKGHHGRYLGSDQYGLLSAVREAVSAEETFTCLPCVERDGMFNIRTTRSKYIDVNSEKSQPELRGDAQEAGETTALRVRMQARFKPKHKVNKAEKVRAKISRKELEQDVGRRLEEDEVKKLKKARREGNYHEMMLDVKVKNKHDKFA